LHFPLQGKALLSVFETKIVQEGVQDGGKMVLELINPHAMEGPGARRVSSEVTSAVNGLL
jgi:hypothetical protein